MENEKMTIVLADGTEIVAVLNGNNYILDEDVDDALLSNENLANVTVNGQTYKNLTCCNHFVEGGKPHLIFRELTETEIKEAELNAQINMLTECLLEMSTMVYQ